MPPAPIHELRQKLHAKPHGALDLGYHGTSIEAITHLLDHGVMPSTGTSGRNFFVTPASPNPVENEAAWDEAEDYASHQGYWLHPASVKFGITIQQVMLVGEDEPQSPKSVTKNQLETFRKQCRAEGRKGVVVALERGHSSLSRCVFKTEQEDELRVRVPGGVPWAAIRLIQPLGRFERDLLQVRVK